MRCGEVEVVRDGPYKRMSAIIGRSMHSCIPMVNTNAANQCPEAWYEFFHGEEMLQDVRFLCRVCHSWKKVSHVLLDKFEVGLRQGRSSRLNRFDTERIGSHHCCHVVSENTREDPLDGLGAMGYFL